jgi:hypothetical protein
MGQPLFAVDQYSTVGFQAVNLPLQVNKAAAATA